MSSVMRGFAEPVTKNFKVDATGVLFWSAATPALAKAALVASLNSANFTRVSESYLMFNTSANLAAAAVTLTTGNATLTQYETLKDMGDQIYIGLQGQSALLVFRLVERGLSQNDEKVGYVCVENSFNTASLVVKVSRV